MTVIFAENVQPSVRGMLRRWFIEPRPNVFVGSINKRTREKTIDFIRRNAPGLKLFIVYDSDNCQGFDILSYGFPSHRPVKKCGLSLVAESYEELSEK